MFSSDVTQDILQSRFTLGVNVQTTNLSGRDVLHHVPSNCCFLRRQTESRDTGTLKKKKRKRQNTLEEACKMLILAAGELVMEQDSRD